MSEQDILWMIGGPQGGGINASAETLAKAMLHRGVRVFANIEYHSNIMGEHSYYRVRLSDKTRRSVLDGVNVLVALDEETLFGGSHGEFAGHRGHVHELVPGGCVIYDAKLNIDRARFGRDDIHVFPVPYSEILRLALADLGKADQANRLTVMVNTVAVAASLALMDDTAEEFVKVLRASFRGRRAEMGEMNAHVAEYAFRYMRHQMRQTFGEAIPCNVCLLIDPQLQEARPMLMRGMHACAIAKLQAGLAFQSYYPISPATDESVYLEAQQPRYNFLVVQAEDEVAAINMAVGAAHAGVRAATSTSGPGFSLMVEGLGFASMTEAPGPVVYYWQRGGPSTGLPTRHEQADLRFALQPAHGEFSHMVVAPGDHQEVFEDAFEAFNWAERYQLPVVVLLDKYLASAYAAVEAIGVEEGRIDRGRRAVARGDGDYLRYAFSDDGISPRAVPGEEGGIFWTTSDEHDPRGHITEEVANRMRMMEKRMGKLEVAAQEIAAPRKVGLYGPDEADVTIVGWGSSMGPILVATEALAASDGLNANFLQIRLMRPFPVVEVTEVLRRAKRTVLVENNFSGQLGGLIREMTGFEMEHKVVKYDGRPFSQEELVEALQQALHNGARRVVVSHLTA
ncbi:MAG: 2-oxoacid:acceptor oxidoreductase subunit alpha [Dehalococcoidia bacterium]